MNAGLSHNILINLFPVAIIYTLFFALMIIFRVVPSYNSFMLYAKKYFRYNVPILLFFFNYQELVLYVCLAAKGLYLKSTSGILSFTFGILVAGYLAFMVYLYLKNVLLYEKNLKSFKME